MLLRTLVVVSLCLSFAGATGAQTRVPLPEPGTRVRLTYPCNADSTRPRPASDTATSSLCSVVGELVAAGPGNVSLMEDGTDRTHRLDGMRRLEISRGQRSHRKVGAVVGFAAGAGAAYVWLNRGGSTSKCDRSANQDAIDTRECIGLTVLGGLAGAGLGAVAGGFVRSERWEAVPLEGLRGRLRVGLVPGKGVGLGVRVAW